MAKALKQKISIDVGGKNLLCKNGCGFYGNPNWQGFCSKCYREVYHPAKEAQAQFDSTKPKERWGCEASTVANQCLSRRFNFSSLPKSVGEGLSKFADFKDKKKAQTEKKRQTVRSIFRKSTGKAIFEKSIKQVAVTCGVKKRWRFFTLQELNKNV